MEATQTQAPSGNEGAPAPAGDHVAGEAFDDAALAAEIANFRNEPQEDDADDPAPAAEKPEEAAPAEEAEEQEAEAPAQSASDSDLDQRLDAVARQEAQSKARVDEYMAQERAKFEKEIQEWQSRIQEFAPQIENLETLKRRARYDLPSVAAELGINLTEDGEAIARQFYSMSKAAADNPQAKEQAQRTMRERELAAKLEAQEKRLEELTQNLQKQQEEERVLREASNYISTVQKAADAEKFPHVKALVDMEPQEADNMLRETAARLMDEKRLDSYPEPADVLAALEAQEKANRERMAKRYGFTVAPPPAAEANAAETKSPRQAEEKTVAKEVEPPTPPQDLDEDDFDAVLMRELKEKGYFSYD